MPYLETWNKFPPAIRQHLIDRMKDRRINSADLNKLRIWVESHPLVTVNLCLHNVSVRSVGALAL